MLCVKREHDRDMIINKCPGSYDLKSNKRYNFLYELQYKTLVFFIEIKSKSIFKFKKSVHAMFLQFFISTYNNKIKTSQNIRQNFFLSSIIQLQTDKQISSVLIIFKLFKKRIPEKCKFYEFLVCGIEKLIRDSRITNPLFHI